MEHVDLENNSKKNSNFTKSRFQKIAEELEFDGICSFPQLNFLAH
ncbi:unnamed protein product, partial [Musa textilis]